MSWKFNPPPGWPEQPEGWVPPPGWMPDPSWPPAPAGWQFWVPADSPPASAPPAAAAPPPAAAAPPTAAVPPSAAPTLAGPPPMMGAPAAAPPYGGPPASAVRPWFAKWWAIVGLIALLLVGSAAGYGGTRAVLAAADSGETTEDPPAGDATPSPGATAGPDQTEPPEGTLPTGSPLETPDIGELTEVCGEVATIMIDMALAAIEAADQDDYDGYVDEVVTARQDAAEELRDLEGEDGDQQQALDTLADEVDAAAEQMDDNRTDQAEVDDSFTRISDAYDDFNNEQCS